MTAESSSKVWTYEREREREGRCLAIREDVDGGDFYDEFEVKDSLFSGCG